MVCEKMGSAIERKTAEYSQKMGSVQGACITGLTRAVRVGLVVEATFEERLEGKRK